MDSKYSKTSDPHRPILNLADKINLNDKFFYQILIIQINLN